MNALLQGRRVSLPLMAAALTTILTVGACASTPPAPTAALLAAQQAISTAEQADASRYAPGEISAARTRLASANDAVTARQMVVAGRLAEQSRAEAELALAKTSAAKANAVNDEMKSSTGTLVEEMQRTTGDPK